MKSLSREVGVGLGGAGNSRAARSFELLDEALFIWQFSIMRRFQTIRLLFVTVSLGLLSCPGLDAQSVTTNSTRTTFEYKESRTYTDLTNSIQETRQLLADTQKRLGTSNTNFAFLLIELAGDYDDLGDYARAATLDEQALAIMEPLLEQKAKKCQTR